MNILQSPETFAARLPYLFNSQADALQALKKRPVQWQADVGEIVAAYVTGGERMATRSYRAICEARKLVRWTALALSQDVRNVLRDTGERI